MRERGSVWVSKTAPPALLPSNCQWLSNTVLVCVCAVSVIQYLPPPSKNTQICPPFRTPKTPHHQPTKIHVYKITLVSHPCFFLKPRSAHHSRMMCQIWSLDLRRPAELGELARLLGDGRGDVAARAGDGRGDVAMLLADLCPRSRVVAGQGV